MTANAIRKKCMEVTGGRFACDADYEMPGLTMHIHSQPVRACGYGGGEVHFVSSCASGRITRILMADIAAHECLFKEFSHRISETLLRNINAIRHETVIAQLNEYLEQFAPEGGVATASIATYFAPLRRLTICNIGNPPALIYRRKQQRWETLVGDPDPSSVSMPSDDDVIPPDAFRYSSTRMETGDWFVLYGNGFAGSSFPNGSIVGHQRFRDVLQDSPHTHPLSRISHLVNLVRDDGSQQNDHTLILCQATEKGVRWQENVMAPFRLLTKPSADVQIH